MRGSWGAAGGGAACGQMVGRVYEYRADSEEGVGIMGLADGEAGKDKGTVGIDKGHSREG